MKLTGKILRVRRWIWGHTFLAAGLLWVACSKALASVYPLSWGGPNIGGGFVSLLAYFAIVLGVSRIISELIAARRRRAGSYPANLTSRRWRAAWWWPVGVSAAAAVVCGAVLIAPPGPGGSGRVGAVGVTVSSDGPVLVLVVCKGTVDTVTLVGPSRGSVPNEKYATLSAPAGRLGRITVLPLDHLPPGWVGGPVSLPLEQRPVDLVIASAHGDQTELAEVAFTSSDLSALTPSVVRLNGNGNVALKDVSSVVCR